MIGNNDCKPGGIDLYTVNFVKHVLSYAVLEDNKI